MAVASIMEAIAALSYAQLGFIVFLFVRVVQRLYYMSKGHVHFFSYFPKQDMEAWLKKTGARVTEHSFTRDDISLR
jgi:hypothetical protein